VTLFFTALAAAAGPLAMAAASDAAGGDTRAGFQLATGFAAALAVGLLLNWWRDPAGKRLREIDAADAALGRRPALAREPDAR
jgi:hypothetical protein